MAPKRYYWLKLYDAFFSLVQMKKLRRMTNGDTCLVIYLRLLQVAMKNEGLLEWKHLEDSLAEELALALDEDAENVEQTLGYLKKAQLAEEMGEEYLLLPYAVKCTGSEGASAERVRNSRQRKQMQEAIAAVAAINDADSVTMCENSNVETKEEINKNKETTSSYTTTYTTTLKEPADEIGIELQAHDAVTDMMKEKSFTLSGNVTFNDLHEVLKASLRAGFLDSKFNAKELKKLTEKYGWKLLLDGIKACALHGKPTIAYLEGCLTNMS